MANFFSKIQKNDNSEESINIEQTEQTDNLLAEEPVLATESELDNSEWLDKENVEGQLSIDVFQNKDSLIIKSTIAGVKPEDVDVAIDNDMITIRGARKLEETVKEDDYFYQECYWGNFSRSIVLPMEIKPDEADASLKNGVLTIVLPKIKKNKSIAVKVKSE
ncbi:Hsp20/alpha crystallin family protein [Patescibacteria group bacterium]